MAVLEATGGRCEVWLGPEKHRHSAAERRALAALWKAADRLVPLGYYVGVLSPSYVQSVAPHHLAWADAGKFIRACENDWNAYLMQGEHANDLILSLLQEHGMAEAADDATLG